MIPLSFSSPPISCPGRKNGSCWLEPPMHCHVRAALLSNYKLRLDEYQAAVDRLKKDGEAILHTEYLLLWQLAFRAMNTCKESQRRLELHMLAHRCYFDSDNSSTAATA